jgi:Trk K+ transport system NAD-binding subunit
VCVVFSDQIPGVDIVGDVLDESVLERAPVAAARAVILALESDNATLLVAKVVRKYAPDVPIIAAARALENVERIVSQVAGQLLSHHVLGEAVSLQPRIKLAKVPPGGLAGRHPLAAEIRERTGCSVVAVERQGEILFDFPSDFEISGDDALYLCGTGNAFSRYREAFAE